MCSRSVSFCPGRDIPDLSNQIILVTGGSAGLGLETIRQLAKHNPAHIYLAARSQSKAEAAIQKLTTTNESPPPISFLSLDLASFASIKAAVEIFKEKESRLDILVNNAGIMMTKPRLTEDGYEIQFGTNHMGHALLVQLLLPVMESTARVHNNHTRVVTLSSASVSMAPSDVYDFNELKTEMLARSTQNRHCISKLANLHYSHAMATHLHPGGVQFVCVHPGMVATDLHHEADGTFLRMFLYSAINLAATSVEKGACSQLWAAVSEDAENGGSYAPVGVPWETPKLVKDLGKVEELWTWTQDELKAHV